MTPPSTQRSAASGTTGDGFVPGLEGVVAFQSAIAEPDRDGGALRYRGVDIDDLVGRVGFDDVWALLVDDAFGTRLPVDISAPAGALRRRAGGRPGIAAGAGAGTRLRPVAWTSPTPTAREHLAATTAAALSYVARSARGDLPPVPDVRARGLFDRRRAIPDGLARRTQPRPGQGDRRLLGVGRGARDERLHVHGAGGRLDRSRCTRLLRRSDRLDVRAAARRGAGPGAADGRSRWSAAATPSGWSAGSWTDGSG